MSRTGSDCLVLKRTNYGEADRILVLLSADYGRLTALARGVRGVKSRLAGGLEPLCINHVEFVRGRGEMVTIIGSQQIQHFPSLTHDYARASLAGQLLRELNSLIEEHAEGDFYVLASGLLQNLADLRYDLSFVETWFRLRLLVLMGRQPDLAKDSVGNNLQEDVRYRFDSDNGVLVADEEGQFDNARIKAWRVLATANQLGDTTKRIRGLAAALGDSATQLKAFMGKTAY